MGKMGANCLGEKVGCVVFMDKIMDELIERMDDEDHGLIDLDGLIYGIYDLGKGSLQRSFLIDFLLHKGWTQCVDGARQVYKALVNIGKIHSMLSWLKKYAMQEGLSLHRRIATKRLSCFSSVDSSHRRM